jgi:hypothetical protein
VAVSVITEGIRDKYNSALQQLEDMYLDVQNSLLKNVVHVNPGMISHRIIVILCNEDDIHWSATFVSNASCIGDQEATIRQCFFFLRYCSMLPNGFRDVKVDHAITWFLELCYSYDLHRQKPPSHFTK